MKHFPPYCLVIVLLLLPGCGSSQDLTRSKAKDILNKAGIL
jgi:hypothetical protein